MIRLSDALLLASTKLRTRKIRTIVTAVMASLIFSAIIFVLALAQGMISSYRAFTSSGLSERYVANVYFVEGWHEGDDTSSPELIAEARVKHSQRIAAKVAEAKRLGIEYDPKSEPALTIKHPEEEIERLNYENLAAAEVISQQKADKPSDLVRARQLAKDYRPLESYAFRSFGDSTGLTIMKGGREDLSKIDDKQSGREGASMGATNDISSLGYLPLKLVESYLLPDAKRDKANSPTDEIPVIVPYSQAEKALGLASLGQKATNQQKLERLDEVKRRAANTVIEACYRNSSSQQQIEETKLQLQELAKAKSDTARPPVEYALPTETSCGGVTVSVDRRSNAERDYQQKLSEFNRKFGEEAEPIQRKLTFRIVGVSPDAPDWNSINTAQSILMSFGGSSLQGNWVIPDDLVAKEAQDNLIPTAESTARSWSWGMLTGALVEFGSAADIRKFKDEQGCSGMECGGGSKPFIEYFGSNSVLIDDITRRVVDVMRWVVLVVAAIAAVLMTGMAGRVITDSRRETAVFRAIGAKRNDIRLIYVLYIMMFSLIVAAIAIGLGLLAAWAVNLWQVESMTTLARLMFIESGYRGKFYLVGIWPLAFAVVAGVILLTGLAAILLPLSRNLVRSPLRDMRDE